MIEVPFLLVREGPTLTLLIGSDDAECQRAAEILAHWWGAVPGSRRTPGGQRFDTGHAEGIMTPYAVALVAFDVSGQVLSVALLDDRPSAFFLAHDWGGGAAEIRVLPVSTVTSILASGGRRVDPRVLSTTFCLRCRDHPLHVDPIFDDLSRLDGTRICNACGLLEALRLDRGPASR